MLANMKPTEYHWYCLPLFPQSCTLDPDGRVDVFNHLNYSRRGGQYLEEHTTESKINTNLMPVCQILNS